jgi:ABC-type lipoprotein export system ATPase subunit
MTTPPQERHDSTSGIEPEAAPLVRTEALERIYRVGTRAVHALQGVDLCIGGLDRPTAGRVWLEGQDLSRLSERKRVRLRRREIGFVFQSFALLPTYSAWENVDLMLRLAGVRRSERGRRVDDSLALVGLQKWADHRPFELSGGQQQRLAIARALSTRPALILADEPTGELDSASGEQILELLRRVVEHEDTTVLMASHDLTVDLFADEVYHLEDGRIVDACA